ncbi:DNA polymerase III subunit beta [Capsulimonas corticalis]|uniref:Beta sliding clamp n=1 Tax=Capsulimonas corticalis TaxID=2219043 RepID=A0A402CWM6_9BACT|nr:DNA polymerase III subunit beta [Capsulimonas corticalis]BDI34218.1 DNA polymerase III subunit beta [Capsulimonas corticalis]
MAATDTGTFLKASSARRELFDGIQTVGKAVATRSSLPILTHVRITAKDGKVSLMATDLEMWMEHTLPHAVVTGEGAATAPARNFTELLGAMPDSDVTFTVEDETNTLHLRCNKANYKLLGLAADEFPLMPQVKEESRFVIDRTLLRDAIKQTLFATSSDETRAILTGVLVIFQGDSLKLVATDTHRLAVRDCAVQEGRGSASAIVPARAMSELQRIVGNEEGEVTVTLSSNQIQFQIENEKSGSTTLISRLIDGQFPNFERVIPTQATKTLTIQREPLVAAVRRAAIVARESANRIVLRTTEDGDRLTITAESGNIGNAYEEVDMAREGEDGPVEIAFNAKYLSDVLNVLDTEGLNIELTEPLRPGVIRPTEDADYLCVLMPMQVV